MPLTVESRLSRLDDLVAGRPQKRRRVAVNVQYVEQDIAEVPDLSSSGVYSSNVQIPSPEKIRVRPVQTIKQRPKRLDFRIKDAIKNHKRIKPAPKPQSILKNVDSLDTKTKEAAKTVRFQLGEQNSSAPGPLNPPSASSGGSTDSQQSLFGQSKQAAEPTEKSDSKASAAKSAPAFSFGASKDNDSKPLFGAFKPTETKSDTAAKPDDSKPPAAESKPFSFGGSSSSDPKPFKFGDSSGGTAKPPASGSQPSSEPQPFKFGASSAKPDDKSGSATPVFSFGQDATKKDTPSIFGSSAGSNSTTIGLGASGSAAGPSLFGNSSQSTEPSNSRKRRNENAGSAEPVKAPFSFGGAAPAANTTSTPAFGANTGSAPTFASKPNFNFGGAGSQPSSGLGTPTLGANQSGGFSFGANTSTPAVSFGANAGATGGTFGFGANGSGNSAMNQSLNPLAAGSNPLAGGSTVPGRKMITPRRVRRPGQ